MAKLTVRELERSALHYAIQDRTGFIEACGESAPDAASVARAGALVAGWRAMLKRRYSDQTRAALAGDQP